MVVQTKSGSPTENVENDENPDNSNSKTESAIHVLNLLKKKQKSSLKNGYDSLELLRMNLQSYFNKQVEMLMSDFMDKFFQPAIENIKENTDEKIDDKQIKKICRSLLEDCAATQYSNEMPLFPLKTSIKTDTEACESAESGTSLLHQALKRKRTESEAENSYKRQFFITTTANTAMVTSAVAPPKPTSSLLTSALTSPPKAMRHSRPIFHLIPNRNLKSTHVELLNLLKQNSSLSTIKTADTTKVFTTTQSSVTTTVSESNSQN